MKLQLIGVLIAGVAALPAHAAGDNAMKVCGAKYQAAKASKSLPAGQTWNQFLASCRGAMAPAAKTASVAQPTAVSSRSTVGQPSAAQLAARARMKQCSAQWKTDKAANKIAAGQTWPKYWSACSARLKG